MRAPHLNVGVFLLTGVLLGCHSVGREPSRGTKASYSPIPVRQVSSLKTSSSNNNDGVDLAAKAAQDDSDKYEASIKELLTQGKFDDLDKLASAARLSKSKSPGGNWTLFQIYEGLAAPQAHGAKQTEQDWADHLASLQRWVSVRPGSVTARIALAEAYVNYAWFARGTEYANEVASEQWKLFDQRLNLARENLQQAWALKEQCPHWFYVMQNVQFGLHEGDPSALLKRAMAFEPSYYYYYSREAHYLMPKWYGNEGDAARFAEMIADKIGGNEGDFVYFLVAARLNCNCQDDETELKNMSWPRIMRGFSFMERAHGTNMHRLNQFARLATAFSDAPAAQRTFTRIGENWESDAWGTQRFFEDCKNWAKRSESISAAVAANLETAEGQQYDGQIASAFQERFGRVIIECVTLGGKDAGKFDMFLRIGKEGKVEQYAAWPATTVNACLTPKVTSATFPLPPKASYWIKISMNVSP